MLWSLYALVGCSPSDGAEPYCELTRTEIPLDDDSELGVSAQDIVDLVITPGPFEETLIKALGGDALLTLTLGPLGSARFVESTAVYAQDGPDVEVECLDRVELETTLVFLTDDGEFAETWDVAVSAMDAGSAALERSFDPRFMDGDYHVAEDARDPNFDEVTVRVDAIFDADGSSGEMTGQARAQECQGRDDCSYAVTNFDVGTWD
ncbi:MAG: hypothetical protein GY913_12990 [Proteobacteria bacterium]|nr:hypothetical protein [Pseudomonadota bacterium]MCP4917823.1 hypothetical protein [Pseudomonadota bacterium]